MVHETGPISRQDIRLAKLRYARLPPAEEGGFVVTFRDIPEAITEGDDEEEAVAMAKDALVTAMEFYVEDGRPVPLPSDLQDGERFVELPLIKT